MIKYICRTKIRLTNSEQRKDMNLSLLFKRSISVLLCVVIALTFLSCSQEGTDPTVSANQSTIIDDSPQTPEKVEEIPTTLISCSDFQNPAGDEAGAETVKRILSQIIKDFPSADGLLCAGDYDFDMTLYMGEDVTQSGIKALEAAVSEIYPDIKHTVFSEGNHDVYSAVGLAESGGNDPESLSYGVFVINEDDYMWGSNSNYSESHPGKRSLKIIEETAKSLETYLCEKTQSGFDKPIFIISHIPLHYSIRTKNDGDGMYANLIFDVINKAADCGLNIVYLYGHDHSNGWDDYLGGAAVFLTKGDSINIAQSSRTDFNVETLNFTYMNAGFVGYYDNHNGGDDALTMCVFRIFDDRMEITRYDADGVHNLKSMGIHNKYKGETDSDYPVDKSRVTGTKTVELNKNITAMEVQKDSEDSSADSSAYKKIEADASELAEGKYILLYNGSDVMSTSVVTKNGSSGERTGFELIADVSLDTDLSEYEWTFEKSGDKWLIGTGDTYIKLTSTPDKGITATLEDIGDEFTVSSQDGVYTFKCGSTVLNYNSRGLINGYASQPAGFELYSANK